VRSIKISKRAVIFLLILIPGLIIYIADSKGLITNSHYNYGSFSNFTDNVRLSSLPEWKEMEKFTRLFKANFIRLDGPRQNRESTNSRFLNGSFRIVFKNELYTKYRYILYFRKIDDNNYYSFEINTGLFERIKLTQYTKGKPDIILEHFIPLWQRRLNTLHIDFVEKHLVIFLNNAPILHLLLPGETGSGSVGFNCDQEAIKTLRHVKFSPINSTKTSELLRICNSLFLEN
jgi:hypothetical protein